jgi:hypothetical protein
MRKLHRFVLAGLAVLASTCFLPSVRADYIIAVSIDTSKLSSDANLTGPFGIDFELTSGSKDSGNTATIGGFNFGGGSSSGPSDSLGGIESGSVSSTVTLGVNNTTTPFSDFNQGFTPGSTLSFQVDLTTNTPASSLDTPDTFTIYLLSSYSPNGGTPIPTTDSINYTLLTGAITSSTPSIVTYGGTNPNDPITTDAAVVDAVATPEPGTLVLSLLAFGSLAGAAAVGKRRGVQKNLAARVCS